MRFLFSLFFSNVNILRSDVVAGLHELKEQLEGLNLDPEGMMVGQFEQNVNVVAKHLDEFSGVAGHAGFHQEDVDSLED